MPPLIVSLTIDDEHQRRFDAERRHWFPPGRTVIGAHITLFHALPGDRELDVRTALADIARRRRFEVAVSEVMSLGRGVAYRLASSELSQAHAQLRREFADALTGQDAQPFRPHVTIQNKATSEQAHEALTQVRAGFAPCAVTATGLALWRYLDGPWEPVERYRFAD